MSDAHAETLAEHLLGPQVYTGGDEGRVERLEPACIAPALPRPRRPAPNPARRRQTVAEYLAAGGAITRGEAPARTPEEAIERARRKSGLSPRTETPVVHRYTTVTESPRNQPQLGDERLAGILRDLRGDEVYGVIAERHGVAPSTVSRVATANGLGRGRGRRKRGA